MAVGDGGLKGGWFKGIDVRPATPVTVRLGLTVILSCRWCYFVRLGYVLWFCSLAICFIAVRLVLMVLRSCRCGVAAQ